VSLYDRGSRFRDEDEARDLKEIYEAIFEGGARTSDRDSGTWAGGATYSVFRPSWFEVRLYLIQDVERKRINRPMSSMRQFNGRFCERLLEGLENTSLRPMAIYARRLASTGPWGLYRRRPKDLQKRAESASLQPLRRNGHYIKTESPVRANPIA